MLHTRRISIIQTAGWLALLVVAANALLLANPCIGAGATLAACGLAGAHLGRRFWPDGRVAQTLFGTGILLVVLALVTGVLYRLIGLSWPLPLMLGIALPALTLFAPEAPGSRESKRSGLSIPRPTTLLLSTGAVVLFVAGILTLLTASTTEAIRSPWHVVSSDFFVLSFALSALFASILLVPSRNVDRFSLIAPGATIALTLLVGLIVYRIGFGYDSFVHQATETHIANVGSIDPKPLYYLGQYGLVVTLHHLTQIAIPLLDRLLLPLLTVLTLPLLLLLAPYRRATAALASLAALALPLSTFVQTTPQGLANLLLLVVAAVSFWVRPWTTKQAALTLLIAITALITHPIAGLPALFLVIFVTLQERLPQRWITPLLTALAAPLLPVLFWIQERSLPATPSVLRAVTGTESLIAGFPRYQTLLDTVYGISLILPLFIGGLVIIGVVLLARERRFRVCIPHLLVAVLLLLNGAIIAQLPFAYLIAYERDYFADRFPLMAAIVVLPLVITALAAFADRARRAAPATRFVVALLLALIITVGTYHSYPRFDTYAFDRGFSTSAADSAAVRAIAADATAPYIVLANQATSAAALREFGFATHFTARDGSQTPLFYYAIPTSGPLYQHYLDVLATPSRTPIDAAMDVAGVSNAYVVLNDYWHNAETIGPALVPLADRSWRINDRLTVFAFSRQ